MALKLNELRGEKSWLFREALGTDYPQSAKQKGTEAITGRRAESRGASFPSCHAHVRDIRRGLKEVLVDAADRIAVGDAAAEKDEEEARVR